MGAAGTRLAPGLWITWAARVEDALACPMPNLKPLIKAMAVMSVIGLLPLGFAATVTAAPASPANTQKLTRALSNGFGPSSCSAAADLTADAIAVVDCMKNALDGGPAAARYILYGKPAHLADHFARITEDDAIVPCAPNEPAPQTWHYDSTPDVEAGQVSCGTFAGAPELVWTNSAKLVMVSAQGADINAMYAWWLANG